MVGIATTYIDDMSYRQRSISVPSRAVDTAVDEDNCIVALIKSAPCCSPFPL